MAVAQMLEEGGGTAVLDPVSPPVIARETSPTSSVEGQRRHRIRRQQEQQAPIPELSRDAEITLRIEEEIYRKDRSLKEVLDLLHLHFEMARGDKYYLTAIIRVFKDEIPNRIAMMTSFKDAELLIQLFNRKMVVQTFGRVTETYQNEFRATKRVLLRRLRNIIFNSESQKSPSEIAHYLAVAIPLSLNADADEIRSETEKEMASLLAHEEPSLIREVIEALAHLPVEGSWAEHAQQTAARLEARLPQSPSATQARSGASRILRRTGKICLAALMLAVKP